MKIIYAIFCYLIGSLPPGYIIFFLSEKKDIRKFGSKNTGATNVLRLKGWKYAVPVLLVDFLKGYLPVYLSLKLFSDYNFIFLCGFLAAFGHCFPVYLKFRGGKGIATTMGIFAALAIEPFILSLLTFLSIILLTRYVSLASILSVFSYPFFILALREDSRIITLSFFLLLLVILRHRENIQRLIRGNERKIGERGR